MTQSQSRDIGTAFPRVCPLADDRGVSADLAKQPCHLRHVIEPKHFAGREGCSAGMIQLSMCTLTNEIGRGVVVASRISRSTKSGAWKYVVGMGFHGKACFTIFTDYAGHLLRILVLFPGFCLPHPVYPLSWKHAAPFPQDGRPYKEITPEDSFESIRGCEVLIPCHHTHILFGDPSRVQPGG